MSHRRNPRRAMQRLRVGQSVTKVSEVKFTSVPWRRSESASEFHAEFHVDADWATLFRAHDTPSWARSGDRCFHRSACNEGFDRTASAVKSTTLQRIVETRPQARLGGGDLRHNRMKILTAQAGYSSRPPRAAQAYAIRDWIVAGLSASHPQSNGITSRSAYLATFVRHTI